MNKEAVEGLKKRLKSLENKLERLRGYKENQENTLKEINRDILSNENEIKGLKEILKPFLVVEKL